LTFLFVVDHQKSTDSNPAAIWFLALNCWHSLRNSNGINVNMGIKGASAGGYSVYVSPFSRCGMGCGQNARMKGIANCTKAQVTAQLPGRVSSKGPPQYHQTLVLPTKSVDWFMRLLKDWLSLHPVRFPTFVIRPPCLVRHEV
jgi:hypothetical protein